MGDMLRVFGTVLVQDFSVCGRGGFSTAGALSVAGVADRPLDPRDTSGVADRPRGTFVAVLAEPQAGLVLPADIRGGLVAPPDPRGGLVSDPRLCPELCFLSFAVTICLLLLA